MGFADVIIEADLDTHDYFALIPVIEGAGGVITDWEGRPLSPGLRWGRMRGRRRSNASMPRRLPGLLTIN